MKKLNSFDLWLGLTLSSLIFMCGCIILGHGASAIALAITARTFFKCLEHDEKL